MKRIRSIGVIAATLALLLSSVLTSCQAGGKVDVETENTQMKEPDKIPKKPYKDFAEDEPYRIHFTTEEGLDGCVAVIEYHPYYEDQYVLEIPGQSPEGVPVTKISSHGLYDMLPHYLLEEDFQIIQAMAENYYGVTYEKAQEYRLIKDHPLAMNSFYLCRFMSYFILKSKADVESREYVSEEEREWALKELSEAFPITDTGVTLYVLESVTDTQIVNHLLKPIYEMDPNFFEGLGYESLMKIKAICEEHSVDDPHITELLENYSGRGKGVTEIVWPSSLREIDSMAFLGCESLTHVTIPATVQGEKILTEDVMWPEGEEPAVTYEWKNGIGEFAFAYCNSLQEITFSEGIINIGNRVFYQNAMLETIRLPQSLEFLCAELYFINPVHDPEFDASSLPHIYFGGTLEQWDEINTRLDVNGYEHVDYANYVYFTVHTTDGVKPAIEYKK